jgi:hypothetical protein
MFRFQGPWEGKKERIIKVLFCKRNMTVSFTQTFASFSHGLKTVMSLQTAEQGCNEHQVLNHWQLNEIKNITQKSPLLKVLHLWKRTVAHLGLYTYSMSTNWSHFSLHNRKSFFPLRTLSNESHDIKRASHVLLVKAAEHQKLLLKCKN